MEGTRQVVICGSRGGVESAVFPPANLEVLLLLSWVGS